MREKIEEKDLCEKFNQLDYPSIIDFVLDAEERIAYLAEMTAYQLNADWTTSSGKRDTYVPAVNKVKGSMSTLDLISIEASSQKSHMPCRAMRAHCTLGNSSLRF